MRNIMKISAMAVALCMIFSIFVFVPYADAAEIDESVSEQVRVLTELGIIEPVTDPKVQLVDTVTRSEFAKIMAKMLGGYNGFSPVMDKELNFSDVDEATAQDIAFAVSSGIMQGNPDGTFEPDIAITYEQAVKCLVNLLGAERLAEVKGGYPAGYVKVASEFRILDGVPFSEGEFVPLKYLYRILYNMLDAPVFYQTQFGDNGDYYTIDDDRTFLNVIYGLEKIKGVITANGTTSLDDEEKLADGKVRIGGEMFLEGATDAGKYLGHEVIAYYEIPKNNTPVLAAVETTSKNKSFTVEADDLEKAEIVGSTKEIKISYYQDGRLRSANLSDKVDVIYNGKVYLDYEMDELIPKCGSVTFLTNTGSGNYNVFFVNSYETVLTGNVSALDGYVTDKYKKNADGSPYRVKLGTENDTELTVMFNGNKIAVSDIKAWDVLTIYSSKNKGEKKIDVVVTRGGIDGRLSYTDGEEVIISGETYKIDRAYAEYLKENGKSLPVGENRTFYINNLREIVGYNDRTAGSSYAWVRKMNDQVSVFGDEVQLRMLSAQDGTWKTVTLANKVNFDGDEDGIDDPIMMLDSMVPSLDQTLIRYKMSGDDKVSEIIIASPTFNDVNDKGEVTNTRRLYRHDMFAAWTDRYAGENSHDFGVGNGALYYLSPSCVSFSVPKDEVDFANEDMYRIGISVAGRTEYNIALYDTNCFTSKAEVLKVGTVDKPFTGLEQAILVTDMGTGIDKDGIAVGMICGDQEGTEVKFTLTSEATESPEFKRLRKGDIIYPYIDTFGQVAAIRFDYSAQEHGEKLFTSGSTFTSRCTFHGIIEEIDFSENIVVLNISNDPNEKMLFSLRIPELIYENEQDRDKLWKVSSGSLQAGQRIMYIFRLGGGRMIEIFK